MANWCYNFVTCTGSADDIAKLKQTLLEGIDYQRTHKEATALSVEIQDGYFFDIELRDSDQPTELVFVYETKWAPNLLDLAEICKAHNVSAVCEYNECGMQIYGTAVIDAEGNIHDEQIPSEFLDLIEYNDETGLYEYDGEEYETEGDIINDHYENWKFLNPQNN